MRYLLLIYSEPTTPPPQRDRRLDGRWWEFDGAIKASGVPGRRALQNSHRDHGASQGGRAGRHRWTVRGDVRCSAATTSSTCPTWTVRSTGRALPGREYGSMEVSRSGVRGLRAGQVSERAADSVEAVFREEWGRLLATLIRWVRDIDLAEEVAADAMAVALERWPVDGADRPAAWLPTTARRRAVDLLRRRQTYAAKLACSGGSQRASRTSGTDAPPADVIGDDRLSCSSPAATPPSRPGACCVDLRYLAGVDRRGRPGVPRAGGDHGPAAGRAKRKIRRRRSRTGCHRPRSCDPAALCSASCT
jgi:hypothetical protein